MSIGGKRETPDARPLRDLWTQALLAWLAAEDKPEADSAFRIDEARRWVVGNSQA